MGYIISRHTWFEGEYKYASVRLGAPVAEFENVLRRLRGLALVLVSILKGLVDLAIWILIVLGPFLVPVALL